MINSKPERRDYPMSINIEPSLINLVRPVLDAEGISLSDYGRRLILWDLIERDLITREELAQIIMGRTPSNGHAKELGIQKENL